MKGVFEKYLLALRRKPVDEKTEHTDRGALETLLQALADEFNPGVSVQHEPKREADKGAPDFKVTKSGLILGYVENKGIDENLNKVLKSEQIKRYQSLSKNIVLTDYLDFIWINKYGDPQRERLCHATDLESKRFKLDETRVEAVAKLLKGFFSSAPEGIGRAQQLALALAVRSRLLRDYLGEELVRQEREHQEGRLYGLYKIFRDQVFLELTLKEFADALAQMLAYGLFLARLNSDSEPVTLHNAREYIPGSFRLIRELVDFLTELEKKEYRDVRWVVEEVLSIVNNLDLLAIHEDLSFKGRKAISKKVRAADEEEHRLFERDPFIYFYEDYLRAYDKETSKSRGVYYTPPPVVNFIVRAIDDILKESFEIPEGLADHKRVTVLDFACGTGTFLLEVFQRIFENIGGPTSARADLIVRDHFLRHIFGFEYLIAPYTVAHLKLSQYLKDQEHPLQGEERLQVLLTNTLEPVEPQRNLLLPAVTAEVEAAQKVKDREILVILGNPPYSGHSKNPSTRVTTVEINHKFVTVRGQRKQIPLAKPILKKVKEKTFIGALIDDYKWVDGKPLKERNSKWLNDDYVKFIRFAQWKMDSVEEGIVGVITNHSWLDNPTFRGMRQSLMRTFQQIYVLDLHGSTKRKERTPDGSKDENVFDIEQGVAISLLIKREGLPPGVWRGDLWGKRLEKYEATAHNDVRTIDWQRLQPSTPFYFFAPQDAALAERYYEYPGLQEIFREFSLGSLTKRDGLTVAFERGQLLDTLNDMADDGLADGELAKKYDVKVKDKDGWDLAAARKYVRANDIRDSITRINWRPFDWRQIIYDGELIARPNHRVLGHLSNKANVALVSVRQLASLPFEHVFVTDDITDQHYLSTRTKEGGVVFPLSLNVPGRTPVENLTLTFRTFLDSHYGHHYAPQEIISYIYAVLHAPTYRARYVEFLRTDFPRIPFPESKAEFDALSKLGWALVQAHLLRKLPRKGLAEYHGKGEHEVEAVRYDPKDEAVWINKTQCFKPVPQDVWDFHIGGYQVLDKYLKSRKGRKLSLDEINHVAAIADALAFTIEQMAKIDEAYRTAFPDRG